jgi:hypothetical protein
MPIEKIIVMALNKTERTGTLILNEVNADGSRVCLYMNGFRAHDFTEYNGRIWVLKPLLNWVLLDQQPELTAKEPQIHFIP